MKVAIVNFSTNNYINIRKKHQEPFIKKYCSNIDYFPLESYELIGSPHHKDSPYAFKLHSIQYVRNKGYDIVIWMDAPWAPIKPIDDWILDIQDRGVWLAEDGWFIGQWANDKCLQYFNETRDDMLKVTNCYCSVVGYDFTKAVTNTFLEKMFQAEMAGAFRGSWTNKHKTESDDIRCLGHRHDQSCSEIIAHKLQIKRSHVVTSKLYYDVWL